MEGHYSTGQSPQWALVSMEEEKEAAHLWDLSPPSVLVNGCFETKNFPFPLFQRFPFQERDILFRNNPKFYDVPEIREFFLPLATPFKMLRPFQPWKL